MTRKRYLLAVDPATTTGIALVSFGATGPLELHGWRQVRMPDDRRGWLSFCRAEAKDLALGACDLNEALWLVESWARHSSYPAAVKLAQIQQAWVGAAESCRAKCDFMDVMKWQAPTGINRIGRAASKVKKGSGSAARKQASKRYAAASLGLKREPPEDVADALCMALVWVAKDRENNPVLPF